MDEWSPSGHLERTEAVALVQHDSGDTVVEEIGGDDGERASASFDGRDCDDVEAGTWAEAADHDLPFHAGVEAWAR